MEALDILRQEHHSFASLSSVFYILSYTGAINTHSPNEQGLSLPLPSWPHYAPLPPESHLQILCKLVGLNLPNAATLQHSISCCGDPQP